MKLVIDRTKWLRGETSAFSYMLRDDSKMCCLGFYGAACGLTEKELIGMKSPRNVQMRHSRRLPESMEWLVESGDHSKDGYTLMIANDDYKISDMQRERVVAETFAKHGVEVEFIN